LSVSLLAVFLIYEGDRLLTFIIIIPFYYFQDNTKKRDTQSGKIAFCSEISLIYNFVLIVLKLIILSISILFYE
jgi:hypothetical protein